MIVFWDQVQLWCKEALHHPKSMTVMPLYARRDYGLCLFSQTVLISFGYSQRLCFLTSCILLLATCDRFVLIPICLMQNCRKIYLCFSHQYAKMSGVTSQHEDPQRYKRKVLGIIPCKCRPVWEVHVSHRSVLCVREHHAILSHLQHFTFLPCGGASGMNASWPRKWMTFKVSLSFAVGFY